MQTRNPAHGPGQPDDAGSLRRVSLALLPLRAFLGFTFCYAGLQKLANPGFFDASDPASIQAQLAGSIRTSPVHALIAPLAHQAVALGLLIAFGELAVGLGTLLGLYTRVAAAGGLALSLILFLTVSFHSHPYFTGADIVFAFAWTPVLLAGPGVPSVDAFLRSRRQWLARSGAGSHAGPGIDRRRFAADGAAAGLAALAGLTLGGMTAAIGRLAGGSAQPSGAPTLGAGRPHGGPRSTPAAKPTAGHRGSQASGHGRPAGTRIGPASQVPVGGTASFTDPASGDPSLVVQPRPGRFLAFDAVCPHAGCTVSYQASPKLFVCPCHGSQFNAQTGAVIVGPATRGLSPIPVAKGPRGQLYVT